MLIKIKKMREFYVKLVHFITYTVFYYLNIWLYIYMNNSTVY